uniref:Xyloglucan endotransglucosylase/hydrolase n=1 Tax=Rhizophora mucronata TaxID=61149 RepID=A0A2P2M0Z6_RHIMU
MFDPIQVQGHHQCPKAWNADHPNRSKCFWRNWHQLKLEQMLSRRETIIQTESRKPAISIPVQIIAVICQTLELEMR